MTAQRMMWNETERQYRGQASDGAVVTVMEDAMMLAHRKAGNGVFDSDWWVETLTRVLEHWGIYYKRWMDPATNTARMHFTLGQPKPDTPQAPGPLTTRIMSGPLSRNEKKEGNT